MVKDMTKGSIIGSIARFTVPLVLGNLFQLTYNAVDSIVIGRFAGHEALAAVGTADPVMSLLILFVSGLCMGASVIMSNYFGARKYDVLRREMANLILLGCAFSGVVIVLGLTFSADILTAMRVPESIMAQAMSYLRIIFIGMPFTCLYNIYAASLRSVGDSKTPVTFLAAASIMNVMLDLLFVVVLQLGAAGAGWATVIAEFSSALACAVYSYKKVEILKVQPGDFWPDKMLIGQTLRYGSATALQQCSQPVGKLFIQGMVNTMGVSTMAAFNVVGKIEDFALVPERSIGNAMMTFTAQNDGAGEKRRVREGLWKGLCLELGYFVFICTVMLFGHNAMLRLFSSEPQTLTEGAKYFTVMAWFYFLPGLTNGLQGFLRGARHMKMTILLSTTQISFRVLVTWLVLNKLGIAGIAYACAVGWTAMLIVGFPYYRVAVYPRFREDGQD